MNSNTAASDLIRRDLNKICKQPYRTLMLHSRGVVLCLGQSEGSEDVEVPLCTSCICQLGLSPILKPVIKSLNADGFTLSPHALHDWTSSKTPLVPT
jgi:hypothetical protein